MPNEKIVMEVSGNELIRPFEPDAPVVAPAPEVARASEAPAVTTPTDTPETTGEGIAPIETPEVTLPPDLEALRKNLLADSTRKTQRAAEVKRNAEALQETVRLQQAQLESERALYQGYRQLDGLAAQNPELRQQLAEILGPYAGQIPAERPAITDSAIRELTESRKQIAAIAVDSAESSLKAQYPDFEEHYSEIVDHLEALRVPVSSMGPRDLKLAMESAYKAVTYGKADAKLRAGAQQELLGQVKDATKAAKVSARASGPHPEPEPSSFRADGKLKSYDEIIADERAKISR